MRKKIIAGNWKMNLTVQEGVELAKAIEEQTGKNHGDVLVIVAPPFSHLTEIKQVLHTVKLAAQNCAFEDSGAYTGEVSAGMIKSAGAEYVIIGHSERRTYFNEDDETLNKKVKLALKHGLNPIFCCGEVLEERKQNNHFDVVRDQLSHGLFNIDPVEFKKIVIAYEPVWAIGTGETATPDQAQEMHAHIRKLIAGQYGEDIAGDTTIQYGGSCKPSNAKELFANPDVDGGLIGGASLKTDDFMGIIRSF